MALSPTPTPRPSLAELECRDSRRKQRERLALVYVEALLRTPRDFTPYETAKRAVAFADALIEELG